MTGVVVRVTIVSVYCQASVIIIDTILNVIGGGDEDLERAGMTANVNGLNGGAE